MNIDYWMLDRPHRRSSEGVNDTSDNGVHRSSSTVPCTAKVFFPRFSSWTRSTVMELSEFVKQRTLHLEGTFSTSGINFRLDF